MIIFANLLNRGELTIGSKIPTERKLAEMLSISRNSTREAISTVYHRFIDKVIRYADDDMKHKLKMTHIEILSALKKGLWEECEN